MIKALPLALAVLITAILPTSVHAEGSNPQAPKTVIAGAPEALKGVPGFMLHIVEQTEDGKKLGLTKEDTQAKVELSMRRNNVPVLDLETWQKTPGRPVLTVYLWVFKGAVSLNIECRENVTLVRDPSVLSLGSTTYVTRGLGANYTKSDDIYKMLEKYVDKFCLEWLRQNPKITPSESPAP
jgi:hypothetical protein